jgi:hypothetical protein
MRRFHHIGLHAPDQETPLPGEAWVSASRCWVTNPGHHPQRVEWLRYPPDTLVEPEFQAAPHICYAVPDLDAALAGAEIVVPPFAPGDPPFGRAAFIRADGVIIEYIEFLPGRTWFDDARDHGVKA